MHRILLAAIPAMLLSGCTVPDTDDGPDTVEVSAEDNLFVPNRLELHQNDAVLVTNNGGVTHSVTIHKAGDPITTHKKDTDITSGTSTEYKFQEVGTYHLYCKYHSGGAAGNYGQGMVMTIVVEEAEE